MRPLNAKQLIKILVASDFVLVRQKGSHYIYQQAVTGIMVPVPVHGKNKVLPIGTFLAIVKQTRLSKSVFDIK